MNELIAHLFGDYVTGQNHWMALNKTKSSVACGIHVLLYTLGFLFVTRSPLAILVIAGTHFVIDRWSLAKKWPAFYGVGCEGWLLENERLRRKYRFLDDYGQLNGWDSDKRAIAKQVWEEQNPPMEPAPPFLAVWLAIIVDNSIHLLLNHVAIAFL